MNQKDEKTIIQQILQENIKPEKTLTREQEEDIKQKRTKDSQAETPEIETRLKLAPTDHREYAEGAILFMELQQPELALSHIKNYDITTKGRKILNRWKK